MKKIIPFFLVLLCSSFAQATIYSSTGSGLWTNCANWSAGCPPTSSEVTDTIIIFHVISSPGNLDIEGRMEVRGTGQLLAGGDIQVETTGRITNWGRIYVTDELHIDGEVFNNNFITTDGIHSDGYMCNTDTVISSPNKYECHGCTLECGGTLLTCEINIRNNGGQTALVRNQDICCPDGSTTPTIDYEEGNFDVATIRLCGNILPIQFVYVNVFAQPGSNQLEWAVAQDQPGTRFEIGRSNDGLDFYPIGEMGTDPDLPKYTFADQAHETGIQYYRIKATDQNGNITYSKVSSLSNSGWGTSLTAFPNPSTSGEMTLHFPESTSSNQRLILRELSGRLIREISLPAQTAEYKLQLHDLPRAIYLLEWMAGGQREILKVVTGA